MADTEAPAPAKKKGGGKMVLMLVVALVLLGGAGGGFWYWKKSNAVAAAPADKDKAEHKPEGGAIVELEPFLVNLADKEASRFLRVNLRLVIDNEEEAAKIKEEPLLVARVRSAILEVLATQRSDSLTTPEGKAELKKAIAEHASPALHTEVRDVLFTDFVVQF